MTYQEIVSEELALEPRATVTVAGVGSWEVENVDAPRIFQLDEEPRRDFRGAPLPQASLVVLLLTLKDGREVRIVNPVNVIVEETAETCATRLTGTLAKPGHPVSLCVRPDGHNGEHTWKPTWGRK